MIKARGFSGCQVEGDSKTVVSWAKGSVEGPWMWSHYIREIRDLLKEFNGEISHIQRSLNTEANKLEEQGVGLRESFVGENMSDCLWVVFVFAFVRACL